MKLFRIATLALCSTFTLSSCNELLGDSDNPSGSSTKPSTTDNSEIIEFKDSYLEGLLVQYFDKNLDYKLSKAEAAAVVDFQKIFYENTYITSFDELQYFTRLKILGEGAFYGCHNIESVIIPGSVETIYRGAFAHCRSLKNVTLLDGIQNIEAAFGYCPIKSIAIPASVIKISNKAFGYSLENVTVDASNKVYDSRDNCNCIIETATNTIVQGSVNSKIPSGITELGDFLFEEIGITSMVVPEGVKKIGHRVFDNCSELQSVTLPSTLESLGYNVFQNCTSLTSIELPSGLTEMGEAVFIGCENLTSIKVPGGVEVIEKYTFGECTNLKSAIFEEGVKTTKGYSFNNCKNLESVEFPSSITSIGFDFIECPKLKKVVVKATTPPTIESSDFFTGMTIYVPAASVDTYKAADYWKFLTIKSVDDL